MYVADNQLLQNQLRCLLKMQLPGSKCNSSVSGDLVRGLGTCIFTIIPYRISLEHNCLRYYQGHVYERTNVFLLFSLTYGF